MSIIWMQLTGSHNPQHPEVILHRDGVNFIGGCHCLWTDEKEKQYWDNIYDIIKNKNADYFPTTREGRPADRYFEIKKPKNKKYPELSWVYHNKCLAEEFTGYFDKILSYQKDVQFIFFTTFPMKNVELVLKNIKTNSKLKGKLKTVYYKRSFWKDEVADGEKYMKWNRTGSHSELQYSYTKEIEKEIIKYSDIKLLADTHNTKIKFRKQFLKQNKDFKLYAINDKIYDLINEIKREF